MSETWIVRGTGTDFIGYTDQKTAEDIAHFMRMSGEDPEAKAIDRMAELLEQFPVGAKVRHTRAPRMRVGIVTGGHRLLGPDRHGREWMGDAAVGIKGWSGCEWCSGVLEIVQ